IHHVVALGGRGPGFCPGAVRTDVAGGRGPRLRIGVHCRAEPLGSLGQVLDGLADLGGVLALEGLVGLVDRGLDLVLVSSETFSSLSLRNFSVWWTSDSAWLRVSAASRRFLSSSACCSASLTIWS